MPSMVMKTVLQIELVKKAWYSKEVYSNIFRTKRDFYFYVLDEITAELNFSLEEKINTLSLILFQNG